MTTLINIRRQKRDKSASLFPSGTAVLASKTSSTAGTNYPARAASCPKPKPPESPGPRSPLLCLRCSLKC